MNFTEHDDPMNDSTHLDASDFTDLSTDHDSMDTGDNYENTPRGGVNRCRANG